MQYYAKYLGSLMRVGDVDISGVLPLIHQPTHITKSSGTVIDNIL